MSVHVEADGPDRWRITRRPSWLGRLFGGQSTVTTVERCAVRHTIAYCSGLCIATTKRCIHFDTYSDRWIIDAVEAQPIDDPGPLPAARVMPARSKP